MTTPQDIFEKVKERYQDPEGGFKHATGGLEQVIEHDGVTMEHLRDYAVAEAEECKRRAEYHKQSAVSRFYNEKVSASLQDEVIIMELVANLISEKAGSQ